jgi:energy-coupling factor transporter transmembrane protein EcfT
VVNFPKLNFSIKTLRLVLLLFAIVFLMNFVAKLPLFSSILISSFVILLGIILKGIFRRVKYNKFLNNIGIPISRATFYKDENIMSVVPFNDKAIACSARIDDEVLLFGRAKAYRSVQLNSIENIEFENYFGHQIARITLLSNKPEEQKVFYIPWSELLESEVEVCEGT